MLTLIRSQSKVLMAILLVLISLSFIVYFNLPAVQALSRGNLGRIAGRTVTQDEFRLAQQATALELTLSRGSLSNGRETSDEVNLLAWRRLVLLSAAREMKIKVSDEEIGDFIQGQFKGTDGKYEPARYSSFVHDFLIARQGINEDRWEEIVREILTIDKTRVAVTAPATVDPAAVDHDLGLRLGEIKLSVLRFTAAAATVAFAPADVEKEYQDNLTLPAYRSPERRTVATVAFLLTPAQAKLPAKEKEAAKRKLGEQAQEFAIAALDQAKDDQAFKTLAAQRGLTAVTPAPFATTEAPAGLPPSVSFNRAAFGLNAGVPISDAVETDQGYYVLKLVAVEPSAALPLAQVRPQVEKNLRERLALRQVRERGEAAARDLHAALAAGKPFAVAAAEAKAPVQNIPAFVPIQATAAVPDAAVLVPLSITLEPGQASDFVPTADGGLIAYVEKRAPAAPALATLLRPTLASQMLNERRQALFADWLMAQYRRKGSEAPAFSRPDRSESQ